MSLLSRIFAEKETPAGGFSLAALQATNPALAAQFLWRENPLPQPLPSRWLHWGCGPNAFEDFLNVDFQPQTPGVLDWDFLDLWPAAGEGQFEGAYSEDTLEHFFLGEQAYILCNLNRLLQSGAVARVLMPSYARLVEMAPANAQKGGFLHDTFGVATTADAINMGMRFSGHRWLHDTDSFAFLTAVCGFKAVPTTCASSSVPRYNGRNLRDESNSASFAHDLVKYKALERVLVQVSDVVGAEKVEQLSNGITVWRATQDAPSVIYRLGTSLSGGRVALANIRSASLSEFRQHYYKVIRFRTAFNEGEWRFDETVKSKSCMNILTQQQIWQMMFKANLFHFDEVVFQPVGQSGHLFVVGELEFYLNLDGA